MLPNFPLIAQAFEAARVSYSKARAITRVATPGNEALLDLNSWAKRDASTGGALDVLRGPERQVWPRNDGIFGRSRFD